MSTYGWIGCCWRMWICFWVGGVVLSSQNTVAQVVPDATLGSESSVITPQTIKGLPSDRIDGGAIRGGNLFHSFREFNVGEGQGAYFSNPDGIERILTRVTGGNISQILGTLGVLGNADLFLINPNGIIFGSNSRLDLNGSLIGSTASSIRFADGIEFSATNPQAPPLLSINLPLGLQYGANPGQIINRSADGTPEPTLQVPVGSTFALVGGDVLLEGGTMKASQGRIELGSVGDRSFVNLSPIPPSTGEVSRGGWALNYDGVQNFRDISLSQAAIVDTSGEGGGDIQVQARRLTLTEGAVIYYSNVSQSGGNIDINTSESVELSGGFNPAFSEANIFTQISNITQGTGATGNLTVKTRRLSVRDGANLNNISAGEGNAGDLTVVASESVELIGVRPNEPLFPTILSAQAYSTGNGGNLTVETRRLIIRDGALVSTNTFNAGRAGNLTVRASESIELIGTNPDPKGSGGIGAGVNLDPFTGEPATGNSGNLTIETRRLTIQGGGQIATSTFSEGNGGDLIINASESVELIGATSDADLIRGSSGLFASAEEGATGKVGELTITTDRLIVRDGARISADNFGPNSSGNLTINAEQLIVQNGGTVRAGAFADGPGGTLTVNATDLLQVTGTGTLGGKLINSALSVRSEGLGAAGSLEIQAGSIQLDNSGNLTADSTAGLGNINIQTRESLILRRNSAITTNSTGDDPGGNININTDNLVGLENSDITANATNSRGGQVSINTIGIFGTQFRNEPNDLTSDITASSALGAQFSGTVEIDTPDVDTSAGLVVLPTNVIDVEGLVARNFCTPQQVASSSFVVTGRGGLPPNPNDPLTGEIVAVEWAGRERVSGGVRERVSGSAGQRGRIFTQHSGIQEAQGWIVAADGRVILTAEAPVATVHPPSLIHPSCGASAQR
ncbi:beta strand repeat-containing protein [Aerosakkonema funiforme]|uniref:S-layer family protein n=1 Tax=Aerosakkonema funiforme FACHB-1375 TaxID=2949571 RepID=A0A926VDQ0_9CYAN|nr:S-layer family protein [Aerosakkonema funiforme]MBD2181937.1 S-layer family protein [Aerosakkonema funiforme FACHB-1375]